jgi:ABC-type transport system substrate-binding protein
MKRDLRALLAAGTLSLALSGAGAALAQKPGRILKMYSPDSPASMSIHEEATIVSERPMMGVFNNLVMFDQHVPQTSLQSIIPDLATSWSWNEEGTELTLPLRQGVTWHDGRPFTAKDIQCTWDLLTGNSSEKLRVNPRKSWYRNLAGIGTASATTLAREGAKVELTDLDDTVAEESLYGSRPDTFSGRPEEHNRRPAMKLNSDFGARAAVHAARLDWTASPIPGVDRRILD